MGFRGFILVCSNDWTASNLHAGLQMGVGQTPIQCVERPADTARLQRATAAGVKTWSGLAKRWPGIRAYLWSCKSGHARRRQARSRVLQSSESMVLLLLLFSARVLFPPLVRRGLHRAPEDASLVTTHTQQAYESEFQKCHLAGTNFAGLLASSLCREAGGMHCTGMQLAVGG